MDRTRFEKPPRWWGPMLSPLAVRLSGGLRRWIIRTRPRITDIEVRGAEHVRGALDAGHGVLITTNHSVHGDPMVVYEAAEKFGSPLYFMGAWQVLGLANPLTRAFLRFHGCFSVDREGTDRQALQQAVEVLQNHKEPLVIFPEGEVYHCNDRITPFREGAAAIAMFSARKPKRPIVVIPAALKYRYVDDPTSDLLEVMDQLEESIHWRPRPELALPERIYALGGALMALKELEYLGEVRSGSLPDRTDFLARQILARHEQKHGLENESKTIPERVKEIRRVALEAIGELGEQPESDQRKELDNMLDEVFLVVQLFSYPGDYVLENPTVERLAETVDKFEEDVLKCYSATVRGERQSTISFGEPIEVEYTRDRSASAELTSRLEERVQQLLDEIT